ncbi:hypothetical protein BGZ99_005969 [Dissophora globulifera]|uniref:EF-hand domain-containing protein n=1 Tax=Dissophora globulifera TaxID=979702 RepID=A0A9P6USN6_9FUNG|nr:hypothetical protein BGZ99_005969 [Dissophora globulifera]
MSAALCLEARCHSLCRSCSGNKTFRRILHSSPLDDVFLTRLYSAFDTNPNSKGVNFKEFIQGLSVFMKGTPDEKLELSFKLYDIDHVGYITRPGLEKAMTQLHSVVAGSSQDETHQIQELVKRIFDDLDVNNDGKLSLEEYKLNSMKEPLIVDFLSQFLADQTDSGSNSVSSALSVPPSPRSGSSPPSPRFGHFAPPSPRLRDSLYGTASGHVFQTSSPSGSFRLSNSHSLLWLNGGVNGSGDLLGKVNEFEGLVAAEEEQRAKKAAAAAAGSTEEKKTEKANETTEASEKVASSVNIVVVPSEDAAAKENGVETAVTAAAPALSTETESAVVAPAKEANHVNGHSTTNGANGITTVAAAEAEVSKANLDKAEANGALEVKAEPTVEETTAKLEVQSS